MKYLAVVAWITGIAVLFSGRWIGAASYIFGMAILVVAAAFTISSFFGPTPIERHYQKLQAVLSARSQPHKSTWPLTPLMKRLIAAAAIVITDEEEERLEQIRRSGFVGEVEVTGRELKTGLPITEAVNASDLWPPDDLVREPAPR